MSAPPLQSSEPITSRTQLIAYLESGAKPKSEWRIGTEHEKFGFDKRTLKPLPYDGPNGIGALLASLCQDYGWTPYKENGLTIALTDGRSNITLEPGGQFELSGAPLETLHQTCAETGSHLRQVKIIGERLEIGMLGMGFAPEWRREEMHWMPKGRYKIMREYMPKRGKLGLDMMLRTCTIQVNLDFSSEADMVRKMRVGLALQPIATAIFADSPFVDGKPSGFLSYRSHVWTDTDPDRSGSLPFMFEKGMGFERYVDYMLDVPMYFVYREGRYIDASGQSFRDFLNGRLPALPGEVPTLSDWTDHLTTAFPDVRLKKFLEMRGADGGPWDRICALPAFWTGILYDQASLDSAAQLIQDWAPHEIGALRRAVSKTALNTPFRNRSVRDIAEELLTLSYAGLNRRGCHNKAGENETIFLSSLQDIVSTGRCPAEKKLELYETRWQKSLQPLYQEFAY